MKLKQAAITITASSGNPPGESAGIRIDIHDRISTVQIMEIKMTPEQFVSALSRLGFVPCEVEIYNTDIVNKKMETKSFEFKLDKEYSYKE